MFNFGKVVFDPGHGTKINAGPNGYYEGDAMLKLGLMLKTKGFELTKEDGSDLDLLVRVKKAKELGANTLISLHTDWVPSDNPQATEQTMVIYSLNRPGDKEIAEYLAKEIAAAIGISRIKIWTRHASYSTPQKPVDYYGILRHAVNLGIEHAFIVEHCNHAQMSIDTDAKLQRIADCYERIFKGTVTTKTPVNWKHIPIDELAKDGLINDPERLKNKIDEPMATWEVVALINNIYQKIKKGV